jgi:hypothetical protein
MIEAHGLVYESRITGLIPLDHAWRLLRPLVASYQQSGCPAAQTGTGIP